MIIELSTTRRDDMVINADHILALLRSAGFEIPEEAVLTVRVQDDWKVGEYQNIGTLSIRHDYPPEVQRKKVSS